MVYTLEEKKKMDNLLAVFAEYTAQHEEFDIAYSDKTGYVRLIIAEHADAVFFKLENFDHLMEMFCMEVICAEVDKLQSQKPWLHNWDIDYTHIRSHMQCYIDRLDEAYRDQAEKILDRYIRDRAFSIRLP